MLFKWKQLQMHFIKYLEYMYFEWYGLKSLEILDFQKSGFQDLTE